MATVDIGRDDSNASLAPTILTGPRRQKQLGKDLCEAAYEGDLETLRKLMDACCDANAADYDKRSAMHLASAEGHLAVVQFLVERQADINIRDRWGGYPLKEAVFNGHSEVRDFLVMKGAKIDPKDEEALSQKQLGKDLCEAASEGDLEQLRKLMDAGADANAADYDKRSAMHLASAEGHLAVVQFLVERQADINIMDRWGGYPLKEAVFNGHSEVRDFLIMKGAQIAPQDEEALSQELCKASSKGDVDTVSKLVECHASVNGLMYHGRSALHLAAAEGHLSTVKLLLAKGANAATKDKWGTDALEDAKRGNHAAVVLALTEHAETRARQQQQQSSLSTEGESAKGGGSSRRSSSSAWTTDEEEEEEGTPGRSAAAKASTQLPDTLAQFWHMQTHMAHSFSTDKEENEESPGRSSFLASPMPPTLNSDLDTPNSTLVIGGSFKEKREARNNSSDWNESRYAQDFIQLEKLGKGGFGSVFKARQRLDMREYAVKKVRLENDPKSPSNQRVIREVRSMATLSHHPNIVRYYGTWQESIIPEENDPQLGDASMSLDWGTTMGPSLTLGEDTGSEHVGPREPITLLYIQMELCTTSLRQILSNEAQLTTEQLQQYLIDVTEGLMHVHSEHYIHRDIKPDNIFIKHNVAKIGDFGLSVRSLGAGGCEGDEAAAEEAAQAGARRGSVGTPHVNNELTRGVGTHLYASPEIDAGARYDEKVDMYALGIVLFEMLHKFGTRMERIDVIGRLKAAMAKPQCQAPAPLPLSSPPTPVPSRNPSGLDSGNSSSAGPAGPAGAGAGWPGGESCSQDAQLSFASTPPTAPAAAAAAAAAAAGRGLGALGAADWEANRRVALPAEMRALQAQRQVEAELVTQLLALEPGARPSARAVRDRVLAARPYDAEEEMRRKDSYIQQLQAQLLKQAGAAAFASASASPSAAGC